MELTPICETTPVAPLFQTARSSVHPEFISVIVRRHTKLPLNDDSQ